MSDATTPREHLDVEGLAAGWRPLPGGFALKATCRRSGGVVGSRITIARDEKDLAALVAEAATEASEYHSYVVFSRRGCREPARDAEIVLTCYRGSDLYRPDFVTQEGRR